MSRPLGSVTRGTTAPNRLRRVDRAIVHLLRPQLARTDARLVVDLGYGATPVTTVELLGRLRERLDPSIEVTGVEIDPARVAAAEPWTAPGVSFVRGGFELPVSRRPLAVRALNVLRQYDETEVLAAWTTLVSRLAPGGLLVEGTCDELGRRCAWVTAYADDPRGPGGAVVPRTLTLAAHLATLQRPGELAERLPKALIHHNVPGHPVHALLAALDRAWASAAPYAAFGSRQRWVAAVTALRGSGVPVLDGPARWRLGEVSVPWSQVAPV